MIREEESRFSMRLYGKAMVGTKNISELVEAVQTIISNKSARSTENQDVGTSLTSEVFTLTSS